MPIKKATQEAITIQLPPLDIRVLELTLVGDSPLICHAWSDRAKEQMLAKQMKKPLQGRPKRNPEQEYEESLYKIAGGYGFPAGAFKKAAVDAISHVAGVTKVIARGAFHVLGDFVKVEGKPRMREDIGVIGMGTSVLTYRGEFQNWRCKVTVRYNANVVSADQILNLFNTAGFAIGIGAWRPQCDGNFGMFHVAGQHEIRKGKSA